MMVKKGKQKGFKKMGKSSIVRKIKEPNKMPSGKSSKIQKQRPEPSHSDGSGDEEREETRRLVTQQNRKNKKSGGFQSMGLNYAIYTGVIRKGYKVPTPIQRKTIPIIMDGKDVVAMARTGSGKTAAFLIPMFEKLQTHTAKSGARALILSPTRELAVQTLRFAKELGKFTGLRAAVVLGGDRMEDQFAALHENPDIIIATPGRFMHIITEMDMKLKSVEYVVFDEADRLFEMGFQEQLHEILHRLPEQRQTLLFSATLPKLLVDFAKAGLHDPTLIRLDVDTKLSENLKMSFLQCRADDKLSVLLYLLKHVIPSKQQTFIFAATKHHVDFLHMILTEADIPCTCIYSSLDPTARKINTAKFQHGRCRVMVVTDLAARGIDIPLLDNVINFHFPAKPKLFVHRVGRVARAGRSGTAFSLICPDELAYVLDLHVFLGDALKTVSANSPKPDENGLFGDVPQYVIDDMSETLLAWFKRSAELEAMIKVCSNAFSHYLRSRPQAANESIKRVKAMSKSGLVLGPHPMFGVLEDTSEVERMKLLTALKSYKANATIFEINSTAKTEAFGMMKKKRGYHGDVIEKRIRNIEERVNKTEVNQPRLEQSTADDDDINATFSVVIGHKSGNQSSDVSGKHGGKKERTIPMKDEENYLNYRPADFQTEQGYRLGSSFDKEAAAAVLDLTGDDTQAMQKKNNTMRWDRKRKRFVRDNNEDPKKKKIRTESGAWISASYKSNVYKDWMKKNKMDAQSDNDDDDDDKPKKKHGRGQGRPGQLAVLGHKRRGYHKKGAPGATDKGKKNKFKNKNPELKRPEQMLKARKIKARKEAFQNRKTGPNKGQKPGGPPKRK